MHLEGENFLGRETGDYYLPIILVFFEWSFLYMNT